jgi:hypothetical protein
MKTASKVRTRLGTALVAVLVTLALPGNGMIVPIEGKAWLRIILITDSNVVCSASVSGDSLESLFALEANSGKVMWRTSACRVSKGGAVSDGAFLLIANDVLEKRSLSTGKIIWATRLDSIPKQITQPRKSLKDRAEEILEKVGIGSGSKTITVSVGLGRTANSYHYSEPILTGTGVLLSREANEGSGGCVIIRCFEDWMLFNAAKGALVKGGSGGILGRTRAATLVGSETGVFRVSGGSAEELDIQTLAGRNSWYAGSERFRNEQLSSKDSCAFILTASSGDQLAYYDDRSRKTRTFTLPTPWSEYQSGWVLFDELFLRYSECSRYDAPKTQTPKLWFEIYDLNGKRLHEVELPAPSDDGRLSWVSYLTKSGDTVRLNYRDQILSVAVPSLIVTTNRPIPHVADFSKSPYDTQSLSPSGVTVYETYGSTNISSMPAPSVSHDLQLISRNSANAAVRWKYAERVVIQRVR